MAKGLYDNALEGLEQARAMSADVLEELGHKKIFVLNWRISRFVAAFKEIKHVELRQPFGLDELDRFIIDAQGVLELEKMSSMASSMAVGIVGGGALGAGVAFGAYSAVQAFAAAGTGTAIAALHGAAAANASMAWIGGGTLAAGGFGMAGGVAILGILVAAPAVVAMGLYMGAKASKNLDQAKTVLAEAKRYEAEYEALAAMCRGIAGRAYMFLDQLIKLDLLFKPLVRKLEDIVETGTDFGAYSAEDQAAVALALSMAGAVKSILDTPIITETGDMSHESLPVAENVQNYIDAVVDANSPSAVDTTG